ncbi:hypothetical protein DL771_001855 [Monosporascus sp. 5C6A]|nr:hypothetical protein DL771_001855 [Monosporascus sp. 5C6A]
MKRIERLSSQLLTSIPRRPATRRIPRAAQNCCRSTTHPPSLYSPNQSQIRHQSAAATAEVVHEDAAPPSIPDIRNLPLPSPHPDRALRSAKLAALHARLSLSSKIPLQTLARTLVDPSADAHPRFNNANLAYVGSALLQYHTSEFLVARYPRLPMTINFAAMKGYAGVPALHQVAQAWGVEAAAAPGEEVDPGLLQYATDRPTVMINKWGYVRAESKELVKYKWRRGMSSRILYDDPFGEMLSKEGAAAAAAASAKAQVPEVSAERNTKEVMEEVEKSAHANFVRAVIGAVYLYCDREAAKAFIKSHVLSRRLDLAALFEFKLPTRELVRLCARENFEPPVARLLSETGRMSRTPVFVVGIYSGRDRLGEGIGPSLDAARTAAAINCLKAWYLYSPGEHVGLPSDTFAEDAEPWTPLYVDIGEIIS